MEHAAVPERAQRPGDRSRHEHARLMRDGDAVHGTGGAPGVRVRRGAQGPRPRGKVTVPGCAMAARAARSR